MKNCIVSELVQSTKYKEQKIFLSIHRTEQKKKTEDPIFPLMLPIIWAQFQNKSIKKHSRHIMKSKMIAN